jgi:septal ring factor EnvC (AmiA/AmiB activator)
MVPKHRDTHPMKPKLTTLALLLAAPCWLAAAPIAYDEVSLLIRMHETDSYIAQQVAQRRLVRPLTPAQEATLKAQGASEGFLAALRNPNTTLSDAEAVAFETRRAAQKQAVLDGLAADAERERARVALAAQTREQEAEAARERLAPEEAARQAPAAAPARRARGPYVEAPFADPFPLVLPDGSVAAAPNSRVFVPSAGSPVQRFGNTLFDVNGRVVSQSGTPNPALTPRIGNGTGSQKAGPNLSNSGGAIAPRTGNAQVNSPGPTSPAGGNSNRR